MHSIALKGGSASAYTLAPKKFRLELKAIIEEGGYSAQQVLNAYETGLFFGSVCKEEYTFLNPKNLCQIISGKDGLTLLLGGNAAGD